MFKKLFGKKKANKPESLAQAKAELLESIQEESLNKHAGRHFTDCLEFLTNENEEDTKDLIESLFPLIGSLSVAQASIALSVCVSLIERGYRNEDFIDKIISLYSDLIEQSRPFFAILHPRVKEGEEGDSEMDVDVDSLYYELLKDRNLISENVGESVRKVEYFSQHIISILSIDSSLISKYKVKLKDYINPIKDYIQGCYWLSRLFDVLFNDPILVIDVDNLVGFEGTMSGVNDNYQLQHLLMSLPELNEQPAINELDLSVVSGTGIHISNSIIQGKWNMYNYEICDQEGWEEIKIGPAKTHELQDFWIWGEGAPTEISVHNGKRVVLLGRPSVKRSTRVQRVFKNMKASIEVEKVLTDEEITIFLGLNE